MTASSPDVPTKYFVTVDVVVVTGPRSAPTVLLVTRKNPPFQGKMALPGGFVEPDEPLAVAAARELQEETGVSIGTASLRQLGTYGDPGRDPRGRTVTTVYLAELEESPELQAGTDAADAEFIPIRDLDPVDLAFDHDRILRDALETRGD